MFNIFDKIVAGLIWMLDAVLLPVLFAVAQWFAGPYPMDDNLLGYVQAGVAIVYPIISTLNVFWLILAVTFALGMSMARKAIAIYFFLLDLIPGLR